MHFEDPQSLRLFIAVCEEGSIAKAAEREFISASALSKRLSDMEASLRATLLIRGQRGVTPTPAGHALIVHAHRILESLRRMRGEIAEYGIGIRGHVKVLAVASAIVEFLTDELAEFLTTHADVRISLEEQNSSNVIQGVEEGIAELGVCRSIVVNSNLECYPLGWDHLAVVMNPSHELADRHELRLEDILDYEFVGIRQHASLRTIVDRVASNLSREVKTRFFVSTIDSALRVVHSGLALGMFPVESIQHYKILYPLRIIPLAEPWAKQMFSLCTKSVDGLSPPARRLFDHLMTCQKRRNQFEPPPH